MNIVQLLFAPRFAIYTVSLAASIGLILLALAQPQLLPVLTVFIVVFVGLSLLGTVDLLQTKHAVLRNYPISAHLRFILEKIRPEMRQYFFEDEKQGMPFSRDKRAVVRPCPVAEPAPAAAPAANVTVRARRSSDFPSRISRAIA